MGDVNFLLTIQWYNNGIEPNRPNQKLSLIIRVEFWLISMGIFLKTNKQPHLMSECRLSNWFCRRAACLHMGLPSFDAMYSQKNENLDISEINITLSGYKFYGSSRSAYLCTIALCCHVRQTNIGIFTSYVTDVN